MKTALRFTFLILIAAALGTAPIVADLGPLEPLADLHRAVHEALGLPEPVIVRLLEHGLPEADLAAVGILAERAAVPVDRIVDLRSRGLSFVDISLRLGLGPEIFYVPFDADPGPPYGRAWGYYHRTPRSEWRTIRLADDDVVRLANLRLSTTYYRVPPSRVIELERRGVPLARVHYELREQRWGHHDERHDDRDRHGHHGDKDHDHDRDRDRDHDRGHGHEWPIHH